MNFLNDKEKMSDFYKLSKEEFLNSYSYITEEEYDATLIEIANKQVVKNEIEKVWLIEDNELKYVNKNVSKLDYFGKEVAVLKTKANWYKQEMLFKDEKENCYWELGIAPICFNKFLSNVINNKKDIVWNKMIENFSEKSIIKFFEKSISKKQYFNMCELEFISKHCGREMFIKAQESRENFINKLRQEEESRKAEQERKRTEEIEKVNGKFDEKIKDIKEKIYLGECVKSEDLEFYKNNNEKEEKVIQNCFLYLAKQYNINIPLATQGYINNRLVNYNFGTGKYYINIINGNKRGSTRIAEYMEKIQQKVTDEIKVNKEKTKIRKKVRE